MTPGYQETPAGQPHQQPAQQQPQQQQQAIQSQQMMDYPMDYMYQADTYRGAPPTDQAAQVRQAIFNFQLPADEDDWGKYIPLLETLVDMVAKIPGIDHNLVNDLNRRMEDIVDRAHSQGRKRIVRSKMQKLIFRLRSYVAQGDTPMLGMTGVTAMITTNQAVKQEVRMPQQPANVGFWPWSRRPQQ